MNDEVNCTAASLRLTKLPVLLDDDAIGLKRGSGCCCLCMKSGVFDIGTEGRTFLGIVCDILLRSKAELDGREELGAIGPAFFNIPGIPPVGGNLRDS